MDPTQDPTQDTSGGLDQQAIDSALQAYNDASAVYQNAAAQLDYANQNGSQGDVTAASTRLDNARTQFGSAARAYSTVLTQVANQRAANARSAKDPNEQRLWANEADKASSQADLYGAEADMYQAKTSADIQNATTRANAALQRAQSTASRVSSQNDASQAQALLANAKAAEIPALSQSTIQLHSAQIQKAQADAQLALSRSNTLIPSQANLNDARAAYISGPEAQSMLSKAELDAAKARGLDLTQGATLDKIQAATGLSDARIQQIYANIGKSQVLPYTDRTSPNLTIFQPSTGSVTGVPNPGYVNTTLQGINDTQNAISEVQNEIANGTMTPDEGTALINNLRQALQYKALGVTPDQYIQAQQQQAQLGESVLNNYMGTLGKGQDTANQFLNVASKVRTLPSGANFSPFATFGQIANNLYGPSIAKAQQLINQVQPVTDKFSALQALSNLSAARQHIAAASTGADQMASANPAQSANPSTDTTNPMIDQQAVMSGVTPQQAAAVGLGAMP